MKYDNIKSLHDIALTNALKKIGDAHSQGYCINTDAVKMCEFAEVIVNECITAIENDIKLNQLLLHSDVSYKIHNLASLKGVIGKIKQHFGVE